MLAKALLLVLLFAAVGSRAGYKLTSRAFGRWVANAGGCATGSGVALHAVVFALLAGVLMRAMVRRRRDGYARGQTDDHIEGKDKKKKSVETLFGFLPGFTAMLAAVKGKKKGKLDGTPEQLAARESLRARKKSRKARYDESKARGDHLGMQRYADDVDVQRKKHADDYVTSFETTRKLVQKACPQGWKASGADICCEQWWPDERAQRCKNLSTGAVWDRTWRAKKFNE
jgi:hypothetical protein